MPMSKFLLISVAVLSVCLLPSLVSCADWTNYVENVPWITFTPPAAWAGQKILALTFDDGPSSNTTNTNMILDTLEKYNLPATFFQTFNYLDPSTPDVVAVMKRMHSSPLVTVGDHTLAHIDLATQSPVDRMNALESVRQVENNIATQVGGSPMTLMRAPYGTPYLDYWNGGSAIMSEVAQQVFDMGFISVGWHLDTSDYTCAILNPADPVGCVITNSYSLIDAGGVGIILFHDIYDHTRIALPQFIEHAISLGYTFTSVEAMIQAKYGKTSAELVGTSYKTYTPATNTAAPVNPSPNPSSSTPLSTSGKPTTWTNNGAISLPPAATPSPTSAPTASPTSGPTSAPTSAPAATPSPAPSATTSSPAPTPSPAVVASSSNPQGLDKSSAFSTSASSFGVICALLIASLMF